MIYPSLFLNKNLKDHALFKPPLLLIIIKKIKNLKGHAFKKRKMILMFNFFSIL